MNPTPTELTQYKLAFHGQAGALFRIIITNILLSIVTLGVYYFWGRVKTKNYLLSNTEFNGERFVFHGNGQELLMGGIKILLGFVVMVGIAAVLPMGLNAVFVYLVIMGFIPFAIYGSKRYDLSRTSFRGIHFSFRGELTECYRRYFFGTLLTGLTFGFYFPYFRADMRRYWTSHAYYGNTPFRYDGEGADLSALFRPLWYAAFGSFGLMFVLPFLVTALSPSIMMIFPLLFMALYIGMIIGFFWWQAAEIRFHWAHTSIAGMGFSSVVTGLSLFGMRLLHGFVMAISLGLAFAWMKVSLIRFHISKLVLMGKLDFEKIERDVAQTETGATGESLSDALDVDMGL